MESQIDEHGQNHHHNTVQQDRQQHEMKTHSMDRISAEYGGESRGTAGRMDAFQLMHDSDRKADRAGGRQIRSADPAGAGYADHGR